jgi:tetratricopeptide (TPR) repeat protein
LLPILLLAAVQAPAPVHPQNPLQSYLAVASVYASARHASALDEIRHWPMPAIDGAVAELRGKERQLRAAPSSPDEVAFGTVEAAVLMHAEAGLLALQESRNAEAAGHLRASTTLFEWSRRAAVTARNYTTMRRSLVDRHGPALLQAEIRERIDFAEYYHALAAAALAMGFPETARPFAARAREAAPLDPEIQLISGCVAESLALETAVRGRQKEAVQLEEEAGRAMIDALALDSRLHEARLRLGKLLLERGAVIQAEGFLETVERATPLERQRYLARLLLGRVAQRRGRPDDAARRYAEALEAQPDSQAARLGLAHALEKQHGPVAARPVVAASLSASRRRDRTPDPWSLYPFGPPGVAKEALARVWLSALDR